MRGDLETGTLVLVANAQFRQARWHTVVAAWAFGRHERFEHLGTRFRIAWWRGTPYLLRVGEARG